MDIKKPTVTERQKAWEAFTEEERSLLLNKGHDYTAGQAEVDAYANFRIIGDLMGMSPFDVAMIYFLKHILSVITYARSGKQESGEALAGRFHDIRNYAFILNELVPDHTNWMEGTVPVFGGSLPLQEISFEYSAREREMMRAAAEAYREMVEFCGFPEKEVNINSTGMPVPEPGYMESLLESEEASN